MNKNYLSLVVIMCVVTTFSTHASERPNLTVDTPTEEEYNMVCKAAGKRMWEGLVEDETVYNALPDDRVEDFLESDIEKELKEKEAKKTMRFNPSNRRSYWRNGTSFFLPGGYQLNHREWPKIRKRYLILNMHFFV